MLPALSLTAVVTGREITLDATGCPTVLVFHGRETAGAAVAVNATVRAVHPDPAAVLVASVIDLRPYPALLKGVVQAELEKGFHKAAGGVPAGADPAAWVVLLPDWQGAAHEACGVSGTGTRAAVVVADAAGRIVCRDQGADPAAAAVAALAEV
jgi:hypothetical protein